MDQILMDSEETWGQVLGDLATRDGRLRARTVHTCPNIKVETHSQIVTHSVICDFNVGRTISEKIHTDRILVVLRC
jgi:hypothetical protein